MDSQTAPSATTEHYSIGSAYSLFSISSLRVPISAILATIGLALLVILPSAYVSILLARHMSMESLMAKPWLGLFVDHAVMLVIALSLIGWLSKGRLADYGLQWPKSKHFVPSALAWGVFFGLLMTVVDYLPQILKHLPPPENFSLAPANIGAWLFFEGIYVGPTEEIPFRGLLQTFLMQRTSGRIRFFSYEMHVAGLILALLFALGHITSFWTGNFWIALGQQIYAFALGILYAYWREKSGSLLAPIVGHNVSDGVEYVLIFLMTWLWR